MPVYFSNDFTGHYPVGTSAIVRAKDKEEAIKLLNEQLAWQGLVFDGTLHKWTKTEAIILQNGEY